MAEGATTNDTVEEAEEWEVPIVLMQEIPKIKYHASPLQFMSEPGVTQAQYEHMLLSGW